MDTRVVAGIVVDGFWSKTVRRVSLLIQLRSSSSIKTNRRKLFSRRTNAYIRQQPTSACRPSLRTRHATSKQICLSARASRHKLRVTSAAHQTSSPFSTFSLVSISEQKCFIFLRHSYALWNGSFASTRAFMAITRRGC